ncbi:MAG: dTDP-4-dehydrorhamnose 3,5-epimerase [Desulfonauticus sp.]|jgi:dTDP-4-dehydrorhamnose 3,5-epimerase|nr:dTDP-4-dehydrorhamnose 3,5-epimerase [Desulfonauticus sp.]
MQLIETPFPGLFILKLKVFEDKRGFFMETYNQNRFASLKLDYNFVQDNHAYSRQKGVLRGLHFQVPPRAQAKLVWVSRGRVLDVAVDLRKGSPTFGKYFSFELKAGSGEQLLIPRGFAHGYLVLEDHTDFMYKVDEFYSPEHERGLYYQDPDLKIDWPREEVIVSDKDKNLPLFKDFESPFVFEE